MLHELLLSLLGYTGDLIIDEREHQNSLGIPVSDEHRSFKLAPDISFIQPSDRYPPPTLFVLYSSFFTYFTNSDFFLKK